MVPLPSSIEHGGAGNGSCELRTARSKSDSARDVGSRHAIGDQLGPLLVKDRLGQAHHALLRLVAQTAHQDDDTKGHAYRWDGCPCRMRIILLDLCKEAKRKD